MTSNEPSPLERAWAVLRPPIGAELSSFPLDVVFDDNPCRVALDAGGARHLLIPARHEVVSPDTSPAVLGMSIRRLAFAGHTETFVDVSCADVDLFPEFDEVVADVLDTVVDSQAPASATVQAVNRWRRLFKSQLVRGLSHQAKLGLFAELSTLAQLVTTWPAFPVDAWRGPLREPHDFEAPRRCLEVKALGAMTNSVTIHGLEQLSDHDGRPLDLILLRVVEDPDGRTIDDLATELRRKVDSSATLRARLAAAGWAEGDLTPGNAFSVAEIHRIVVENPVPRLVADSLLAGGLPDGMHKLRYDLDLTSLLPHADSADLATIAGEAVR